MNRKTYIKPNSYTQQKKIGLMDAVGSVIGLAGINIDEHNELIFETGCLFVEQNAPRDLVILTEEEYKFWDWWFYIFVRDDQNIVNTPILDIYFNYYEAKQALITDELTIIQFDEYYYGK